LFAGAKELSVLEEYRTQYNIPLFDRSVDFGVLYFLTKPFFLMLNFFFSHIGNFGLALMLLTVVIKLVMYPLANKSYVAMSQMKRLQPEMMRIREQYIDDKMRMNQEIMDLYRKQKVNPAAGCLPILLQIPVFFALYKVLFVTIEMRHAPFYGWIQDLSAPDPTNVFTLFGMLDWSAPSFLHIGVLPILFCATMIVQQKLNPPPADPMQAKILTWMPFLFLYMFAKFPAGLVLYWTWSNLLSILQQKLIMISYNAKHEKKS
jgi:YidC/Oxa1 family membrane protein insertase